MGIFEQFITDFLWGNRAFDSSGNNGALRWNILVRKQKHNVQKAQLKGSYQSGGRILPVMAYTGRLRPKGVRFFFQYIFFFRLCVYVRVGIPVFDVYERVQKSVAFVCKKAQEGRQEMHFLAEKKSRKRSGFAVIYSI